MSIKKLRFKGAALFAPALTVLCMAACGGSAVTEAGGAGGPSGMGGGSNQGGTSSAGTGSTAGSGHAGSGAGGCAGAACPGLACGPGFVSQPAGCCNICVPGGSGGTGGSGPCNVACAMLNCAQGYHVEEKPGDCCGTCVQDDAVACAKGQQAYVGLREGLLKQPGVSACKVNADCTLLDEQPYCGGGSCFGTPVSSKAAPAINAQLNFWEKNNCSTCMPESPPCLPPLPAACFNGTCSLQGYL